MEALCSDAIRILSPTQPMSSAEAPKPAPSAMEPKSAAEVVEKSEPVNEAAEEPDAVKEKGGSPRSADGAGNGSTEKAKEGVIVLDD